jgi:hypothetical protein
VKKRGVDDAEMVGVAVATDVNVVTDQSSEVAVVISEIVVVSETVVVVGTSSVVVEVAMEMETLVAVSVTVEVG